MNTKSKFLKILITLTLILSIITPIDIPDDKIDFPIIKLIQA